MRVLLDKGVPYGVRDFLSAHEVETVEQRGWGRMSDAELLKAAEAAGFNVFVTTDQNIVHQQNLGKSQLGIVALGSNIWPIVRNYGKQIAEQVDTATRGSYALIEMPSPRKQSLEDVEKEARSFLASDKTTLRDVPIKKLEPPDGTRIQGPVIALTPYHLAVRSGSNTFCILDRGQVRGSLGHDPALGEKLDINFFANGRITVKPQAVERGRGGR